MSHDIKIADDAAFMGTSPIASWRLFVVTNFIWYESVFKECFCLMDFSSYVFVDVCYLLINLWCCRSVGYK